MARTGRPPVARTEVECACCGRSFLKRITELRERNYCSQQCQRKEPHGKRHPNRTCEQCGTEFYAKPSYVGRYCSYECLGKSKTVEREQRHCLACGRSFGVRPKSPVMHCSAECAGVAPVERIITECDWCHGPVEHRITEDRRFCSRECFFAEQTATAIGHINQNGYRIVTVKGKRYLEHRYVMEQHLGRKLFPWENVHHINGDKTGNGLANLELWITKQPKGQRVDDKVAYALSILRLYAPERLAASYRQGTLFDGEEITPL